MRGPNAFTLPASVGALAICLVTVTSISAQSPAPLQRRESKACDVVAEDVHYLHGKNNLAGTIVIPRSSGPHPAVVMVLGSGAWDRNYGGAMPALASHFAQHGVACLAWDKPGVGKSTGDYTAQSFRDRADEALAAVDFLRARSDIKADQIGVWGHSQGGMVAPLVASLSDKIAFVIDVGGWQGPAWQQDAVRVEAELRADGFSEVHIAAGAAFSRMRMDLIRGTQPFEDLDRNQQAVKSEPWFNYVHYCDKAHFYASRSIVNCDLGPSWEAVHCPVLVIFGDRDTSSGPPEPLLEIIRRGLARAGNADLVVKIFHEADHSLCVSKTGGPKEARDRSQDRPRDAGPDFVEGYLEAMTHWIELQCSR